MSRCLRRRMSVLFYWWPVSLGIMIFFLGFVSMLAWWFTYSGDNPRGLFYYSAAVYGDAISLPLIAFSLGMYVKRAYSSLSKKAKKYLRVLMGAFGSLGAAIGIGMQASWLVYEETNWTLEKREEASWIFEMYFTAAGWWHAVFFVIAFGVTFALYAGFTVAHACTDNRVKNNGFMYALVMISTFAGGFYTEMHFADYYPSRVYTPVFGNVLSKWILATIGLVLCLLVLPSLFLKAKIALNEVLVSIAGGIIAVAFADIILLEISDKLTIVCCALISFAMMWVVYKTKAEGEEFERPTVDFAKTCFVCSLTVGVVVSISCICLSHELSFYTIIWLGLLTMWPFGVRLAFARLDPIVYRDKTIGNSKTYRADKYGVLSAFIVLLILLTTICERYIFKKLSSLRTIFGCVIIVITLLSMAILSLDAKNKQNEERMQDPLRWEKRFRSSAVLVGVFFWAISSVL